ncbi:MAG: hypothetical protein U0835_19920 [Isosphaeraceae bacterium]
MPADPRPVLDWFYLSVVRNDMPQSYEAARALSHALPNDPLGLYLYLRYLRRARPRGQPRVVRRSNAPKDPTPPLPAPEVDHVLTCYQALRQRRPDLADSTVVLAGHELQAPAPRAEQEEELYRDVVAKARSGAGLVAAIALA